MNCGGWVVLFPETPRAEYENNPLEEVICQIKFPSILKIGTTRPADFQDQIRHLFPIYEEQSDGGMPIPAELRGMLGDSGLENLLPPQTQRHYRFSTDDELRSVALQTDFIALSSKNYKNWVDFREQLELVEHEFRSLYRPSFYSRIGLRYRNVITRTPLGLEECPWGSLFRSELAGLLGNSDVSPQVTQAVTATHIMVTGIEGAQLRLQYGLPTQPEQVPLDTYVIDTDIFVEQKVVPDDIFTFLNEFNKLAGNIFRWAITPTLHDALEPRSTRTGDVG